MGRLLAKKSKPRRLNDVPLHDLSAEVVTVDPSDVVAINPSDVVAIDPSDFDGCVFKLLLPSLAFRPFPALRLLSLGSLPRVIVLILRLCGNLARRGRRRIVCHGRLLLVCGLSCFDGRWLRRLRRRNLLG